MSDDFSIPTDKPIRAFRFLHVRGGWGRLAGSALNMKVFVIAQ
jgi:hypothetical protein